MNEITFSCWDENIRELYEYPRENVKGNAYKGTAWRKCVLKRNRQRARDATDGHRDRRTYSDYTGKLKGSSRESAMNMLGYGVLWN